MTSVSEQDKGDAGQKVSRATFAVPVMATDITLDCAAKYRVALLTKPDKIEDHSEYETLVAKSKLI